MPAATSTTTSATATTWRCATSSRRWSPTTRRCRRRRGAEVWRYTKLFWMNSGGYNNLTARKFVLRLAQRRSSTPPRPRRGPAPASAPRPARRRRDAGRAAWRRFLDAAVDPMVTQQDAGRRRRHPARQRQQPLRRRDDGRSRGLRGALSAQLAAGEARRPAGRRGLPRRRPLRRRADALVAAPRGGDSVGHAAVRRGARARWSSGIAPARTPIAPPSTSPGCEATDTPVDTMNGFIEVYMDARGIKGAWEGAGLLREPREDRAHPAAGRARAVVRRPHADRARATASRWCRASPRTAIDVVVEAGDSGPITPIGVNLPNDQRIREVHGSKSVTLSNVTEAYENQHHRRVPPRVLLGRRRVRARQALGRARQRAGHRDPRGARPRLGPHGRGHRRAAAGAAEGAVLGARGDARRPRGALLLSPIRCWRSWTSCRPSTTPRSSAPSTRPSRATRWCSCAGCARARSSRRITCATARPSSTG